MFETMTMSDPAAPIPQDETYFDAIRRRDRAFDGRFVFSVRTTGVYCRPSCAARLARRENVAFHATCEDAERAGFRACLRCKPKEASQADRHAAAVARACRLIDAAEEAPSLAALAKAAGLSRYHFHRVFKDVMGVTPKEYGDGLRARRLKEALPGAGSVTAAIYEAGYGSASRVYENAAARLGMRPGAYRDGGTGAEIRFAVGECSLGAILVAATERGVCAIELGDDANALVESLQDRFPRARLVGGDAGFEELVAAVVGLVEEPRRAVDLPLDLRGTAFQERVWQALRQIPAGETRSYAEIAALIGQPSAARAVALACAANPTAVAIPCHRVVRTDGSLSGYRWGVERKRALLAREAA